MRDEETLNAPSTLGRRAFLMTSAVAAAVPILGEADFAQAKLASQR